MLCYLQSLIMFQMPMSCLVACGGSLDIQVGNNNLTHLIVFKVVKTSFSSTYSIYYYVAYYMIQGLLPSLTLYLLAEKNSIHTIKMNNFRMNKFEMQRVIRCRGEGVGNSERQGAQHLSFAPQHHFLQQNETRCLKPLWVQLP